MYSEHRCLSSPEETHFLLQLGVTVRSVGEEQTFNICEKIPRKHPRRVKKTKKMQPIKNKFALF